MEAMVGCKLQLTEETLRDVCYTGLQSYFNTTATRIATWGNSSILDQSEWLNIEYDSYSTSATWSGSQGRSCIGIPSIVNWQFLTKRTGSVYNPQIKIVRVRVKYQATTWQFTNSNSTDPQDFVVYGTASFYSLDDRPSVKIPTSPPLFPKLPHDTLYPLYTNSASSGGTASMLAISVAVLATLWMTIVPT